MALSVFFKILHTTPFFLVGGFYYLSAGNCTQTFSYALSFWMGLFLFPQFSIKSESLPKNARRVSTLV